MLFAVSNRTTSAFSMFQQQSDPDAQMHRKGPAEGRVGEPVIQQRWQAPATIRACSEMRIWARHLLECADFCAHPADILGTFAHSQTHAAIATKLFCFSSNTENR